MLNGIKSFIILINKIRNIVNTEDKKRLISNFFSLAVLQGANYILPLLTLPYLIRVLGIDTFGLLAFATAVIAYFNIVTDYGFNLTATREISIHRDDKNKVIEIFSSVMTIKVILMFLTLLLLTILVFSFDKFSKDWEIYFLTFGTVIGQVLFPVWFFQGMERMKYITYLNIFAKSIFTVAIFIFVQEQSDFWIVPILTSTGFIIAGIWSLFLIKKEFNINFKFQSFNFLKRKIIDGWYVFLSQVKISLFSNTNTVILGLIAGNQAVGYFVAAEKLIRSLASLQVPVTQTLFPYISKEIKIDKMTTINKIFKISKIGTIIYSAILIGIFIFSEELIILIFCENMTESVIVLKILLIIPLTIFLNNMFGTQILLNLGKDKLFFKILLSIALLNIIMVIPLTLYFSYIGTAISVLISEIFLLVGMYMYTKKEFIK